MRLDTNGKLFTILLGVFAGLPALSIDVSSPTLVELPSALGTTTFVAGLTLSGFMVGFAVGLLLGGRLSDGIGRRPVLLAALSVFAAAGLACALAESGPELAVARLVQGLGAGGCSVLAYAMVQDLFQGEVARNKRSYITVILGVGPVLAPALGAWLSAAFGWRSVHVILVLAGAALLGVSALTIRESLHPTLRHPEAGTAGLRLRDDRRFVSLALINALSYGCLFAYIAGAPVVTIGQMGLSPGTYATLFACSATALSIGAWTSALLGSRGLGAAQMVGPAVLAQAASAIALAMGGNLAARTALWLTPILLLGCFTRGLIAPNLVHLAMGVRQTDSGLASATIGVVQLLAGAFASMVVAALLPYLQTAAVTVTMAVMAGAAASLWLGFRLLVGVAVTRL